MTILPELDDQNTPFWTGGREGSIKIVQCQDCDLFIHPPERICPKCLSRNVEPQMISGSGTIYSYTVNHQPWVPDMEVPFTLVVVDITDAPGVRITGQLKDADIAEQIIGENVRMDFKIIENIHLPFFHLLAKDALS